MFSFVLYQGEVSDFHIEDMFHKTGVHVCLAVRLSWVSVCRKTVNLSK